MAKTPASFGWIDTPRGRRGLRRIPYLSELRNRSLQQLTELASQGIKFDRILFLNDVIFTAEGVTNFLWRAEVAIMLLGVRWISQSLPSIMTRDLDGFETVTSTFPYFRNKASRQAMVMGRPVPV